ncbi:MAG: hypothetical protein KDK29_18350 [Sedimentitalea sp.]|nr:hypothetical protein [Sedimentitalea sp.]
MNSMNTISNIDTVPEERRTVVTLQDVGDVLEDAAGSGMPSIADWPHRAVDFRIMERILEGLDHPVEAFGTLFPTKWRHVPPEIRHRIPGNPVVNHMRLVARFKRVIGLLRPDIDPWSALRLLADVELPTNSFLIGEVQGRAGRDGLNPIDIDSSWIAERLADIRPEHETQHRGRYHYLVRLSQRPRVRHSGLLRMDLSLPETIRQRQRAVVLPNWLQEISDRNGQPARNALDRLWRTIQHHGLEAACPDDIMELIAAGKLHHAAAQCVEPIKSSTWRTYIQRTRKALRPVVI